MQTIRLTYPLKQAEAVAFPSQVLAIGEFDGVHLGHQEVILRTVQRAKRHNVPAAIMTFHPHPREVLGQTQYVRILTPLEEKLEFFSRLGARHTYVVSFDETFSKVTPERFVEDMLIPLGMETVVVGFDFRFGHKGKGTPDTLCEHGKGRFAVEVVRSFHLNGQKVSSTFVRECLSSGQVDKARALLGRPYRIQGRVVSGQARGRTIGFPTANIELSAPYVLPANGVYGVTIMIDGVAHNGIMNLGVRPTFEEGETQPSVEVHIFDFDGNIYGKQVAVELLYFLRPEKKFSSVEELVGQIRQDIRQCKAKQAAL